MKLLNIFAVYFELLIWPSLLKLSVITKQHAELSFNSGCLTRMVSALSPLGVDVQPSVCSPSRCHACRSTWGIDN